MMENEIILVTNLIQDFRSPCRNVINKINMSKNKQEYRPISALCNQLFSRCDVDQSYQVQGHNESDEAQAEYKTHDPAAIFTHPEYH